MKQILSQSIATLCHLFVPEQSFGTPEEDAAAAKASEAVNHLADKVDGETPPDFASLDPDAKPAGDLSKPEAVKEGDEFPEIPKSQPEGTPKVEVKPPEAVKPEATPEPKKEEPSKVEEFKVPTDEEIEAIKAPVGTTTKSAKAIETIREQVVKPMKAQLLKVQQELEEAKKLPVLDDAVKAQLERAKQDREWREAFELENDPVLQEGFSAKTKNADEAIIAKLTSLGVKPEVLEKFKEFPFGSEKWKEWRLKFIAELEKTSGDDDLVVEDLKDVFRDRINAEKEKDSKISELRKNSTTLIEQRKKEEQDERKVWSDTAASKIVEYAEGDDRFMTKQVAATASPAEMQAIEEHNKMVKDVIAPQIHKGIEAMWGRDPDAGIRFVVKAIRFDAVQKENATIKADLEKATKRITELESDAGGVRRVSAITSSAPNAAPSVAANFDMTAEEAIDSYLQKK